MSVKHAAINGSIVGLLLLYHQPSFAQWAGFHDDVSFDLPSEPGNFAVADFNNDGWSDFAVSLYDDDLVAVYLNSGEPGTTFEESQSISGFDRPGKIISAELNGDGNNDLLLCHSIQPVGISTLVGNGDGTFSVASNLDIDWRAKDIVTGDFNDDGILDLAYLQVLRDYFSVALGNGSNGIGDGSFTFSADYLLPSEPRDIVAIDFDGDEILDILHLSFDSVSISFGNGTRGAGDGSFSNALNFPTTEPTGFWPGDFNSDGVKDLAVTKEFTSQTYTTQLLVAGNANGEWDGTFSATPPVGVSGGLADETRVADFNLDGIDDVIVQSQSYESSMIVFLGGGSNGVGDGTLNDPIFFSTFRFPFEFEISDFDRNGFLDVVTLHPVTNSVNFLLNAEAPDAVISPLSLEFGNVELGANPSLETITIENGPLGILRATPALASNGQGTFELTRDTQISLLANEMDSFGVQFTPSTLGQFSGHIALKTNSSSGIVEIPIVGQGVDTQSPAALITYAYGDIINPSTIITLRITAEDNPGGSGLASTELFYRHNEGTWQSAGTTPSNLIDFDTATNGEGTYEFYSLATDVAGNSETSNELPEITVEISSTPPIVDSWHLN